MATGTAPCEGLEVIPLDRGVVWQHPWLRLELTTRYVIGRRLEEGASRRLDAVLARLIAVRLELERSGWWN